jgi:hypothetical protein
VAVEPVEGSAAAFRCPDRCGNANLNLAYRSRSPVVQSAEKPGRSMATGLIVRMDWSVDQGVMPRNDVVLSVT